MEYLSLWHKFATQIPSLDSFLWWQSLATFYYSVLLFISLGKIKDWHFSLSNKSMLTQRTKMPSFIVVYGLKKLPPFHMLILYNS